MRARTCWTACGTSVMCRVDSQLWMWRWLIRSVDAGKALDLPGPRAGVEALRVTALALIDGRVDEHLDERQIGFPVCLAEVVPIGGKRRNQRQDRNRSRVRHQARHLPDPADVLGPVGGCEPEILREPVPDVVAVEQVSRLSALHQPTFERHRDRRLSGCREPRQEDGGAALVDCQPAIVAVQRRGVPRHIPTHCSPISIARAERITPAPTVSLLSSSIRMNEPVSRLNSYGSASTGALVRTLT